MVMKVVARYAGDDDGGGAGGGGDDGDSLKECCQVVSNSKRIFLKM